MDKAKNEIVIKTLNKKYYKRFTITDLIRRKIPLDASSLSVEFLHGTLIISYAKPDQVLQDDKKIILEIKKIKQEIQENPDKKYNSDCKNQ